MLLEDYMLFPLRLANLNWLPTHSVQPSIPDDKTVLKEVYSLKGSETKCFLCVMETQSLFMGMHVDYQVLHGSYSWWDTAYTLQL